MKKAYCNMILKYQITNNTVDECVQYIIIYLLQYQHKINELYNIVSMFIIKKLHSN